MKTKNSNNKILPLVRIETRTSERRKLDLESDVPNSILTEGNILSLNFLFSCSKASDANIGIITNVRLCKKNQML